jgi:hypothetical protein
LVSNFPNLHQNSQKRIAIDCDQVFANIAKIKEARDEENRLEETWEQQDLSFRSKKNCRYDAGQ